MARDWPFTDSAAIRTQGPGGECKQRTANWRSGKLADFIFDYDKFIITVLYDFKALLRLVKSFVLLIWDTRKNTLWLSGW